LYDGLKKAYPDITIISTAYNENAQYNITIPKDAYWDTHHYEEPQYFLKNFNFYDNWQESTNNTDVGILLGEFSVYQIDTPNGQVNWSSNAPPELHVSWPRMISAISEGVYALGAERNPDTVRMSSYAPSLMNRDWWNWTPDMISFEADPSRTVLSASYWQQWLFARYRGTHTIEAYNEQGNYNPLFWAAALDEKKNEVYLKVINTGNKTVPLSVSLDRKPSSVNGTIIQNDNMNAYNSPEKKDAVVPKKLTDTGKIGGRGTWSWTVPINSITVLQFNM
jgi:alpha-L-arabinofuranosidase